MENSEELALRIALKKDKEAAKEVFARASYQGIRLASTQKLYEAKIRKEWSGFTVPAFNIRTLCFDTARAAFRQAIKNEVGPFIFELARSESEYAFQDVADYVPLVLAAAVEEKYKGNVFFQLDHCQAKVEKFSDPLKREEETESLKNILKDAIKNGVYNVDIDASTLARPDEKDAVLRQKGNFELTALLTSWVRSLEPEEAVISIGGEVGEIGKENTRPEDVRAFIKGYREELSRYGDLKGLIKLAVQTGAIHGGKISDSGKIARLNIDFELLKDLSFEAEKQGLAGVVQHGASTLPEEYFGKFPESGTLEIHLATAFQNIVLDSDHFPEDLSGKMNDWLQKNAVRKEGQAEDQFVYENRKKALGPFKGEILKIPREKRTRIAEELEEKFGFLFRELKVTGTRETVNKIYQ